MRDVKMFIDGEDVEGIGWTYILRSSACIDDPRGTFDLKRALELGKSESLPQELPRFVEARCAWGVKEHSRRAIAAAHRASAEYALMPLDERIQIIRECREMLIERVDEVIELLVIEGHPRKLAAWELSGLIRNSDDETLEWYGKQLQSSYDLGAGRAVELRRKADGVVCVSPPANASGSNGSLALFALMAGNSIVMHAPRSSPLSLMYVYRDIVQSVLDAHGAPQGTMNVISGRSQELMRDWTTNPLVDDILFFGGSDLGLKLGKACIENGIKPILELSGNDGLVVWKDADLREAAKALSECFFGSGQICMVPKYAIVHPDVAEEFLGIFLEIVENIRPGYPEGRETLLSPVLRTSEFYDFLGQAKETGCQVLAGGNRVNVKGVPDQDGLFFDPTVVRVDGLEKADQLSCVREETFFPLIPVVVPAETADSSLLREVVGFLNGNQYGLRNSFWSKSMEVCREFAARTKNGGQLKINDSHVSFHSLLAGHGGTGKTGGSSGELNYVGLKTSHLQGVVWGDGFAEPFDELVKSKL